MKSFVLDVSPTGVYHKAHIANDGSEMVIEEYTPTSVENQILDECARLRSLHQTTGRGMKLAAKIPSNTHAAWKKEWREKYSQVYTWSTFIAMKLNSRENEKFRVGHKRGGSMKL